MSNEHSTYTTMDSPIGRLVIMGDGATLDSVSLTTTLGTTLWTTPPNKITESDPAGRMGAGPPPGMGGGVSGPSDDLGGGAFGGSDDLGGGYRAGAYPEVVAQLRAYFAGELRRFEVAHSLRGTEFQRRVWAAVDEIRYGTTISYGRLAERVGAPRDRIRAVAAAVGANPLLVVRPCHRVLGADGSLTGYAGGVPAKRSLLVHEGALQPELV